MTLDDLIDGFASVTAADGHAPAPPLPWTVEQQAPFGAVLQMRRPGRGFDALPVAPLRALLQEHRLLVLRGLAPLPDRDAFAAAAARFGELLAWNFGHVLDLVVQPDPKNYLFTREAVPYHWDGAFAAATPALQVFRCLQAPPPGAGGETTFCDTVRLLATASAAERARWSRLVVTYRTDALAHYGGCVTRPLVDRHPLSGEPVLRFAEPVVTGLNPVTVEIDGLDGESQDAFLAGFVPRLYAPEVSTAQAWQAGDIVLADNHALIHGRRPFAADAPRHLQRIHVL